MLNLFGMDISSMDGVISWDIAAARGISFATIRASWGLDGIDTAHSTNMNGAFANNIKRIPYHWFVTRKDARAQAQWFVAHSINGELPRMVDLEDTVYVKGYAGMGVEVLKFLAEVNRLTGEICLVYTSPSYIRSYLQGYPELSRYPLVIAHWDAAAPSCPLPWHQGRWQAHQFTGKASAPYYGITQCHDAALYTWNGEV